MNLHIRKLDRKMVLGWDQSAEAWLTVMGSTGDFSRFGVLDAPMLKRVVSSGAQTVLDVGCGEGRFCRIMSEHVPLVTGLDPTRKLLDQARLLGGATYVEGHAESLPFDDGSFECVVSYLSLIDIADATAALSEMSRVLKPGGRLLIANLASWNTASQTRDGGWDRLDDGAVRITVDRYLEEHAFPAEWHGISIENWHRPLSFYMQALLGLGLGLRFFDEPAAVDPAHPYGSKMNKAPYLIMMEWQKPQTEEMA
ncbi:MAG: class I SAM-dependent methyltransferase [Pseudomonadota bacterium]